MIIDNPVRKKFNLDQEHKPLFITFEKGQKTADPKNFTNVKEGDVLSLIIENSKEHPEIDYHLVVRVTGINASVFFHDLEYLIIPDTADIEDESEHWDVHYASLDPSSIPRYRYLKLGTIEDYPEYLL